jgi:general secretion pathway protein G
MTGRQHGFTLLELIVVVAILGLILGMAVPSVIAIQDGEKARSALALLDGHADAIQAFGEDMKRLPQSLAELVTNTTGNPSWKGPYLDAPAGAASASVDPWRTTLSFQVLDQKTSRVRSAGPDGAFGSGGGGGGGSNGAGADDLVRDVSIAQGLRAATRFTVERLNAAIVAYNGVFLATQPLSGNIDGVVATLRARSLLPDGFDWTIDGFGVKLSTSAPPVTYVVSTSGS